MATPQFKKVVPLRNKILVKRATEQEKTAGGIFIPEMAKDKPVQGTIVAVGNGRINDEGKVIPLDVKEGDNILFGRYAGNEVKVNGEELLMMTEDEVLCKLL